VGGAAGHFQAVCPNGRVVPIDGGIRLPVTGRVLRVARTLRGPYFFTATVRHFHLEIYVAPDPYDRKAIEGDLPLTTVDSTMHGLAITYALLVAFGVIVAGIVGAIIARSALAPIRRFTSQTEQVTSSLDHPRRLDEEGAIEIRRLAASFNQTLTALERSVEAQRHLIADASHELRTPIAALRSNIQIFLEADQLPPGEQAELRDAIMAELDDLTQLVADVLELARGSAPNEHVEELELDAIVREAIDRARRRSPQITFRAELEPTLINNSSDRVSRAVTNVIENARKWSPENGVVEVTLRGGLVTVRDHGPGFREEDLAHVFERFYRSADARRMPGSGLGLAIVKQAAEAHGGLATVANAADGGAIVRISFGPARGASDAPPEARAGEPAEGRADTAAYPSS
jgi:two-component system sensor histidine kinase MprB